MNYKLLFPSKYIGAHDLNGRDLPVTIDRVAVEDLKTERGSEKKPVVYFKEFTGPDPKRMVLNKTNATTIAALYGNEVNNWTGKRIALFGTPVAAFGKTQDAIRVRPTTPKETTNAPV